MHDNDGAYGCFINLMILTGVAWWTIMMLACCAGML